MSSRGTGHVRLDHGPADPHRRRLLRL